MAKRLNTFDTTLWAKNWPYLQRCIECRAASQEKAPSVCLSVKHLHCDKTEERSVQIFFTIRKII